MAFKGSSQSNGISTPPGLDHESLSVDGFPTRQSIDNEAIGVLHVIGSPSNDYYFHISVMYSKEVVSCDYPKDIIAFVHHLIVFPDSRYALAESKEQFDDIMTYYQRNELCQYPQVKRQICDVFDGVPKKYDTVVSNLLCLSGMTTYRAFFEDILKISVVGVDFHSSVIASNKIYTKSLLRSSGVKVPDGQIFTLPFRKSQKSSVNSKNGHQHNRSSAEVREICDQVKLSLPVVVKPACEDNSRGVSLVRDQEKMINALESAFSFGNQIIIEEFIPGYEIRSAVLEVDGQLLWIPSVVLFSTLEMCPIRTTDDKLLTDIKGNPMDQSGDKAAVKAQMIYAKHLEETMGLQNQTEKTPESRVNLADRIKEATLKAHRALNGRDFSLFDFRFHKYRQELYIIESCPFWEMGLNLPFVSKLLNHHFGGDKTKTQEVILDIWKSCARRTKLMRSP